MRLAELTDLLQRRRAATIFERARDDYQNGRLHEVRGLPAMLSLLSLIVLATPLIFVGLAVALLWSMGLTLGSIVLSALFLLVAGFLLWTGRRQFGVVWTPHDAPATFALIDAIRARTGAPVITGLVIDDDMNAFALRTGGQNYLGFGVPLWAMLTEDERTAVIAHECAHFVNGDCLRNGLTGRAFRVLQRWHHMVEPANDSGLEALVFQFPAAFMLELLAGWMLRLAFIESQRAEYLADAIAAEAVTAEAMSKLLRTQTLAPIWWRRHLEMHGGTSPKGHEMLKVLGSAVRDPHHPLRETLLEDMQSADHKLDASHPPTRYRLQFLQYVAARDADQSTIAADWDAIAREWDQMLRTMGDDLHAAANPQ